MEALRLLLLIVICALLCIGLYGLISGSKKRQRKVSVPSVTPTPCPCLDAVMGHMTRIQHKIRCPVFRELNPRLTIQEFFEQEGFPGEVQSHTPWPPIEKDSPKVGNFPVMNCGCDNPVIQTTNDGNRHQSCSNCGWRFDVST